VESPHFSISIPSPPPNHAFLYLNPLFPPSSLGKDRGDSHVRAAGDLFITVCTETRAAEKRMKTWAAEASAYRCQRLSDTQNVSFTFTHTFPRHTPLLHVPYPLFPAVRQCDRSPCGRGATCQEAPGGYRCLCPPGWTGRTCQLGQCLNRLQKTKSRLT